MSGTVHLVKLCVGAEKVSDLAAWQQQRLAARQRRQEEEVCIHVTRMWPKRHEELLNGGSLYWVFKGLVLARQSVLRLDEVIGDDGVRRCGIILNPQLTLTEAQSRRPFQGWRYLSHSDAPKDVREYNPSEVELPNSLHNELATLGVL